AHDPLARPNQVGEALVGFGPVERQLLVAEASVGSDFDGKDLAHVVQVVLEKIAEQRRVGRPRRYKDDFVRHPDLLRVAALRDRARSPLRPRSIPRQSIAWISGRRAIAVLEDLDGSYRLGPDRLRRNSHASAIARAPSVQGSCMNACGISA